MGNLIKTFKGKRYRYFSSTSSLSKAKQWAKTLRTRDGVMARVKKDERSSASTFHIFTRRKK